jgi:hypothetical protein
VLPSHGSASAHTYSPSLRKNQPPPPRNDQAPICLGEQKRYKGSAEKAELSRLCAIGCFTGCEADTATKWWHTFGAWKVGNPHQLFGHKQCELSDSKNGACLESFNVSQIRGRDLSSASVDIETPCCDGSIDGLAQ